MTKQKKITEEDNSPLGVAEKGHRLGREWFDKNIERDYPKKPSINPNKK